MQQGNIPLPYQFLSAQVDIALVNQHKTSAVSSQAFFDTFLCWLRAGNHDTKNWNACVFGKAMTSLQTRVDDINSNNQKIFRKHRTEICWEYLVHWDGLHVFLKKIALYYTQ